MSSSSETSYVVGDRGVPTKCPCGLGVVIFTSKTQENPGRPFFRCISKRDVSTWTSKRDGHLFKWDEDCVFEEVEDALPKLGFISNEINKMKTEADDLKAVIELLKEDATFRQMEIRKWKVCLKVGFVWLCIVSIALVYLMVVKAMEKKNFFLDF